jgi:hypothetical protein
MMPGGIFQITLKGQSGKIYSFEASEDLVSWTPAGTMPAGPTGEVVFSDAQSAGKRARFYRAKQQ